MTRYSNYTFFAVEGIDVASIDDDTMVALYVGVYEAFVEYASFDAEKADVYWNRGSTDRVYLGVKGISNIEITTGEAQEIATFLAKLIGHGLQMDFDQVWFVTDHEQQLSDDFGGFIPPSSPYHDKKW